jgi:serine/threonine-protein kinase ATR
MAAMQSVLHVSTFTEVTLLSWQLFITKLTFRDIGPYIGSTSAAFVKGWNSFDEPCRKIARETLEYLILENGDGIKASLDNIVSLAGIPELEASHSRLEHLRRGRSDTWRLDNLLERCSSENLTVASLSLLELKQFMGSHEELMRKYASGDVFDPAIRSIVNVLFSAAARDGEAFEDLRIIAYECIGLLGAVDPDRFDPITKGPPVTVIHNFVDEGEAVNFALHLIRDLLVDAFRSTSDLRYQSHLAYAIQELLKFCGFTPDLIKNGSSASIPIKIRGRWSSLPTHMLDTIAPLLEGKFSHDLTHSPKVQHPLYETTSSYREWIQLWASHLITRASGPSAKIVFGSFRLAVRSQDVEVARYLIPHLVLNVLISGEEDDRTNIRLEILSVLQDQVDVDQGQMDDRRLLSAQVRFPPIYQFLECIP